MELAGGMLLLPTHIALDFATRVRQGLPRPEHGTPQVERLTAE